ncbi:MAG: prepilin peptidase [Rhizomicrobium sp.]
MADPATVPFYAMLSVAALLGLLVGSFLATLVIRLPRGQPIALARSACPHCGHLLGALELIPVLSWVIQSRRCRVCGGIISVFYPAMEIASAAIAAGAVALWSWPVWIAAMVAGWAALCVLAWALRFLSPAGNSRT